jgi:hypothetical protein
MTDFVALAERYVSVWNERDDMQRRRIIEGLCAPDGFECTKSGLVQGYGALYERITTSHERNVRDGGCLFRYAGNADGHHAVMKFNWTMNAVDTGAPKATGAYILSHDDGEKIKAAYFFSDPPLTRS